MLVDRQWLANGFGDYFVDLADPARAEVRKLHENTRTGSPQSAMHIFEVDGQPRALRVSAGKLYDLQNFVQMPFAHPLKEYDQASTLLAGPTGPLVAATVEVWNDAGRGGMLVFDPSHPAEEPQLWSQNPARKHFPRTSVVAGENYVSYVDTKNIARFFNARGELAFPEFYIRQVHAINGADIGVLAYDHQGEPRAVHLAGETLAQPGDRLGVRVTDLRDGRPLQYFPLQLNHEARVELRFEDGRPYAVVKEDYAYSEARRRVHVVDLLAGTYKSLNAPEMSTPLASFLFSGRQWVAWGTTRGEVVTAPLAGPSRETDVYSLGLPSLMSLQTFAAQGLPHAVTVSRGGLLAVLRLSAEGAP